MKAALARHDAILESAVRDGHGRIFKYVGDAVYAAFDEPDAAVRAAVAAQAALHSEPWPEAAPIRVRMALHTGPADSIGSDYVGPTLNRCARLVDLGHGGQTLLSLATREAVIESLPEDASLSDLAAHRLRDLAQPERVFQLNHPSVPSEFPPVRSLDALPHNLPMRRSRFVGRETEMAEVEALVRATALVTLTGPGGCGKTRLALQVAGELAHRFADGVWFVPLESLREPGIVPQRVASALGVTAQPGLGTVEALVEYLRPRDLLLVIDNCEHLIDACARLAGTLTESCPRLKLVATSHEPLGVEAEHVWMVPPLGVPEVVGLIGKDDAAALDYVNQFESVQLFAARAELASPGFELRAEDARAVAELCRRLDGMPLAIELAAARTPVMAIDQIIERLHDRFALLASGRRDAVARHQALGSLVDWSYGLLDESEQLLFRRLSVFRGGWTLSAAEAVCADDRLPAREVADVLGRLLAKSMVRAVETPDGPRQEMLGTLHDYAWRKLSEEPDAGSTHRALVAWAAEVADGSTADPRRTADEAWLHDVDVERDNMLAAIAWSTRALHSEAVDPELLGNALALAAALVPYWEKTGQAAQGLLRLERLLDATPAHGAPTSRTWALIGAGRLACRLGNYVLARAQAEEALGAASSYGNSAAEIGAMQVLALSEQLQGRYAIAREIHEACLARQDASRDPLGVAETLFHLGNLALEQGDEAFGHDALERSLALRRTSDDGRGVAASLNALASLAHRRGDLDTAYALFMESLQLSRELGDRQMQAAVLGNLGWLAGMRGDVAPALPLLEESLRLDREIGDRRASAEALHNIADLLLLDGLVADAAARLVESLAIRTELGDLRGVAAALEACARVALEGGLHESAARWLGTAEALREAIGSSASPHEAQACATCAFALRVAMGDEAFAAAALVGRGLGWRDAGREALDAMGRIGSGEAEPS